ncbi:MAG: hypothetical protein RI980_818 [Bacteroidota bacterium]|jgi:hypothetical protein
MYKVEIELPTEESEIVHIQRPKGVEITISNDEFLNASGHLSEIIIRFIIETIGVSILNKIGEDIYEYLKKIILKNNESKNKSDLKFKIENKDFRVNFSGNNLNSKNTEIALREFANFLDKIPKHSTKDQNLVFNESSNRWEFEDSINSNWIDDLRNNAM